MKRLAFTMAEILLSLTIIGVVAAITLPSLTGNINERTWNTQRKALYARMTQAIALMPSLNGYGTLTEVTAEDGTKSVEEDNAAETFVTAGLSKVLKINNICDNTHLEDCGIPSTIVPIDGGTYLGSNVALDDIKTLVSLNYLFSGSFVETGGHVYSHNQPDTKAVAFETANGESILTYYYPYCQPDYKKNFEYSQKYMCANFIYDLNGNKGPNTVGKDIGFITALYPSDSVVVAPLPLTKNLSQTYDQVDASGACTANDSETRLPNIEEVSAMFYNKKLLGDITYVLPTSTVESAEKYWFLTLWSGNRALAPRHGDPRAVRCIKR